MNRRLILLLAIGLLWLSPATGPTLRAQGTDEAGAVPRTAPIDPPPGTTGPATPGASRTAEGLDLPTRETARIDIPPSPRRWVTDEASFLSRHARLALDAQLEAYQARTGHQVVVWIGRTTGMMPLEDFAVTTFKAWKVGRKGIDDGIVMFILAEDRRIDIEVGYGLEPDVPDAVAKRIIDDVMVPRIRAGDRDGAVRAGVESLLAAIDGRPVSGIAPGTAARASAPETPKRTPLQILGGILLGVFLLILFITHPRLAIHFLFLILSGNHRHGAGGGFRGGGGRSGGGGARGSW